MFCEVRGIRIVGKVVVLLRSKLETVCFSEYFHAFQVKTQKQLLFVDIDTLVDPLLLNILTALRVGNLFIILRYEVTLITNSNFLF